MKSKKYVYILISIFILTITFLVIRGILSYNKIDKLENNLKSVDNLNNENVIYNIEQVEIIDDSKIGTLSIPKINLNDIDICESVELETLAKTIGHFESTSIYEGNVGLASHNAGTNANYFENINKLKKGDEIYYKTKYGTKKYLVETIVEIDSYDWSYLQQTEDNRITLITCVSNKPNVRLCVQGVEELN